MKTYLGISEIINSEKEGIFFLSEQTKRTQKPLSILIMVELCGLHFPLAIALGQLKSIPEQAEALFQTKVLTNS